MNIIDWIQEVANRNWNVYIKRLSANDTGATKSNQVGIYFPKNVLDKIFPSINDKAIVRPEVHFKAVIDSHSVSEHTLRAIYYNQKTRNEKRITRWKNEVEYTPVQDAESTGSIALFAFHQDSENDADFLRVWVCKDLQEEEFLESLIGEIEPVKTYFDSGDVIFEGVTNYIPSAHEKYPEKWNEEFPAGSEIIDYLLKSGRYSNINVDTRILKRRDVEFKLFKQIEEFHSLPLIKKGFDNVEDFIKLANSISNRRKSRSGRSLELHLEAIFRESGITSFGTQCKTEGNKRPDFIFPSCESYHNTTFSDNKLRMLAVKTTVKDRWRQALNEANRINSIHLFTLQQGVSENQFTEMKNENVRLVVPKPLHVSFPKKIRDEILTLEYFINEIKSLY